MDNEREYTVLKFTHSLGVCLPPEWSEENNVRRAPVYCFSTQDRLIYRLLKVNRSGETYHNFFRPVFRGGETRNTAVVTVPKQWHVEPGETLTCQWDQNQVTYRRTSNEKLRTD
jgi:hypothetical protein